MVNKIQTSTGELSSTNIRLESLTLQQPPKQVWHKIHHTIEQREPQDAHHGKKLFSWKTMAMAASVIAVSFVIVLQVNMQQQMSQLLIANQELEGKLNELENNRSSLQLYNELIAIEQKLKVETGQNEQLQYLQRRQDLMRIMLEQHNQQKKIISL